MNKYLYAIILLLLFASCEKEIQLPYRSIDPLYVVQGYVNNENTEVSVTLTKDMEDGRPLTVIPGARVHLMGEDGANLMLEYAGEGIYRPADNFIGIPGKSYTLTVTIDGEQYSSSSRMHQPASIQGIYFRWMTIMNENVLFFTMELQDIPGEDNYYCYRMRRNGFNYKWNVLNDKGRDGEVIITDIYCMTETEAKDNKEEDWDDILYEGDIIEMEVQTIDRRTYDYLYSLRLSERTSANPIDNFTGGCLGYFSAYSTIRQTTVFSYN